MAAYAWHVRIVFTRSPKPEVKIESPNTGSLPWLKRLFYPRISELALPDGASRVLQWASHGLLINQVPPPSRPTNVDSIERIGKTMGSGWPFRR